MQPRYDSQFTKSKQQSHGPARVCILRQGNFTPLNKLYRVSMRRELICVQLTSYIFCLFNTQAIFRSHLPPVPSSPVSGLGCSSYPHPTSMLPTSPLQLTPADLRLTLCHIYHRALATKPPHCPSTGSTPRPTVLAHTHPSTCDVLSPCIRPPRWLCSCSLYISCSTSPCFIYTLLT